MIYLFKKLKNLPERTLYPPGLTVCRGGLSLIVFQKLPIYSSISLPSSLKALLFIDDSCTTRT